MSNEFYAHGQDHAGIETVIRLQAVKRWHMIDTTRQQTLAEHSANVALLVWYIAVTSPDMFFGPASHVTAAALLHDIPEVFTGDIPSHTKKHLHGIDELEASVTPAEFIYTHMLPRMMDLIKFADLADGIRFIRLHGVDVTARHAREQLEVKFTALTEKLRKEWPRHIEDHVRRNMYFYAYEQS